MTIECSSCHAKFAGKEEFAGRRIRCPKCQNVFRVPAADGAAAEPVVRGTAASVASPASTSEQAIRATPVVDAALAGDVATAAASVKPARPKNKYAGVEIDEWNVPEDFEYSVTDEVDANAKRCVYCNAEMKSEDVLCLTCGYNRELGQKMSTKSGEEVFADEQRALNQTSIDFAGMRVPKKALWLGSGVAAILALLLFLFAPLALMVLLVLGGSLLVLVGHIGVIYVAFQENTTQGLLVWFLPIYWWIYVYSHWELAALPFIVWAIGMGMILAGGAVGWSAGVADVEGAMLFVSHLARLA